MLLSSCLSVLVTHSTCDACVAQQLASPQAALDSVQAGALTGMEVAAMTSEQQAAGVSAPPPQQTENFLKKKEEEEEGKATAGQEGAFQSALDEDSNRRKKRQKHFAHTAEAAAKAADPAATNAQPDASDNAPNTGGVETGQLHTRSSIWTTCPMVLASGV